MTEEQYQKTVKNYAIFVKSGYVTILQIPWMFRWDVAQELGIPGDDFLNYP